MFESLQDEMRKALDSCIADIRRRHIQAGQRATGKTSAMLEARVRREGLTLIGEIWGFRYTGAWETGTRPARRRGSQTEREEMVQNLKEWCVARGLTEGMNDKQATNLAKWFAWYIKRYGSKLYREGGRRDIITPAVEMTKQLLADRAVRVFELEMSRAFDEMERAHRNLGN